MIDFKATNTGDLSLNFVRAYPEMKINFAISEYPAMKLQFLTEEDIYNNKVDKDSIVISFRTDTNSFNGMSMSALNNKDSIRQMIMMRLRTEYGDLSNNKDYGSRLNEYKHLDIRSEAIRNRIASIVYDTVKDLLEDPSIIIRAEKSGTFFSCQNLNIYIYEKGRLFFDFSLAD